MCNNEIITQLAVVDPPALTKQEGTNMTDIPETKKLTFSSLFLLFSCLFITFLLVSNIIAGKIIIVFGVFLPAAVIIFPITYIFGDILTEVYGFQRTRIIIWLGFLANLIMSIIFIITIMLPYPTIWKDQNAYSTVLGFTPRLVIASLIAYLIGEFANSIILSRLKVITQGRWLWIRTISSTIIGEGVDAFLFISIAFYQVMPNNIILGMIIAQFLWKTIYEIILTPVTYLTVKWVKHKENMDVYDKQIKYNPFSLEIENGKK